MVTSPDTGPLGRLEAALRAHRGDDAAYQRLGNLLRASRLLLDPKYGNRRRFIRERFPGTVDADPEVKDPEVKRRFDAAYKTVYNLESGHQYGVTVSSMLPVADAYAIDTDVIAAVLNGADFASPPPAVRRKRAPRRQRAATPEPAADQGVPSAVGMVLSPEAIAGAQPYANDIFKRLRDWTVGYARAHPDVGADDMPRPTGRDLFRDEPRDAGAWDLHAPDLSDDELVWLIAALRARAASRSRPQDRTVGLTGGLSTSKVTSVDLGN